MKRSWVVAVVAASLTGVALVAPLPLGMVAAQTPNVRVTPNVPPLPANAYSLFFQPEADIPTISFEAAHTMLYMIVKDPEHREPPYKKGYGIVLFVTMSDTDYWKVRDWLNWSHDVVFRISKDKKTVTVV